MKNKETEQENQRGAEEFTWEEDTYEERQTTENREEPEAEDLFAQASEEKKTEKKERLDLIYPDPAPKVKKPETEAGQRIQSARARKSYKKGLLLALFALCAVVVAGLLISYGFGEMLRHNTSYTLWESGDKMDLAAENSRISGTLGGLVLSGGADGLSAYGEDQSMRWNISYKMSNPALKILGDYALVVDVGGKAVLLCNTEGMVYSAITQYSVLSGTLNTNGWVTVIGEDGLQNEVLVYDTAGTQVLRRVTDSAANGQPMCAVLSEDQKTLVTAYTSYDGSSLTGRVTFFDLSVSGGIYQDRIQANFTYSDLIIAELYLQGSRLVAVGDNRIVGYDISGVPEERWNTQLSNQIRMADYTDGYYAVVYGAELSHMDAGLENMLVLYNMNGEEVYRKQLENPSFLQAVGGQFVYGEGRSYVCIDNKGRSRWFYNALEDVEAFYWLTEGKSVLKVSGSSIQTMNVVGAEKAEDRTS